jgi:hypothetical protein
VIESEDEPGKDVQSSKEKGNVNPGEIVTPEDNIDSAVRKLAKKKPEEIMEFMAMGMGSMANPLHHKMNAEHISKVLNLASDHDEREYNLQVSAQQNEITESKSTKLYAFISFLVVVLLTIFVLYTFQDKPLVLMPVITGLGGITAGFIGGYGLGKQKK